MDWKEIAKTLGMPETSSEGDVKKRFAEVARETVETKQQLSLVLAEMPKHGLKLDGGKVVKVEPAGAPGTAPKADDDQEKAALRAALLANHRDRLSAISTEAEKFMKGGQLPPAVKEPLSRLLSIAPNAQALALSADKSQIVTMAFDALADLRTVLNAIPSLTPERLSQLQTEAGAAKDKEAEALSTKGASVAKRVQGKKEKEAAGKK